MLQLQDVTKAFGEKTLLEHVTWQVGDRDRVGLCGPNGAGKTTLLKMLAGLDEPDAGFIQKPNALTLGYLPQDGLAHSGRIRRRRGQPRAQAAARSEGRRCTTSRSGSAMPSLGEAEHEAMLARYSEVQDRFRLSRRLPDRAQGRDRAARPRLRAGGAGAADRSPVRRLADAARAGQAAARASRICCCSTSRPTISISTRATGSRNISSPIRTR